MINELVFEAQRRCEEWHLAEKRLFEWDSSGLSGPSEYMIKNLYHNYQIWHLIEDYNLGEREQVRFVYEGGAVHNRLRNYAAVDLDRYFTGFQSGGQVASEGIGAILDKINILTVKIMHLRDVKDVRLEMMEEQRKTLISCANELLEDMKAGRRQYRVFERFKITGEDFDEA